MDAESRFAKKIGAKKVKNSGRGMNKADMVKDNLVIDHKSVSKTFSLSLSTWKKLVSDAASYGWGYVPMLVLEYKDGPTLVVMDYHDWEEGWTKWTN